MSLGILVGSILLIASALAAIMSGVAYLARRRQRPVPGSMETAAAGTLILSSLRLALAGGFLGAVPPVILSWSTVAAYLAAAWFALTVVDFLYIGEYLIEHKGRDIPDVVRTLLIYVGLAVAGLIVLRVAMNINVVALVAVPTVATAVIGVALKDTLARFFAGLRLGKMLKTGDWVATLNHEGVVTDIAMQHVTLLTREQDLVILPNDSVIQAGLVNYSRPTRVHVCAIDVETHYRTPPLQVCAVLEQSGASVEGVLGDPAPTAYVVSFNESGVLYRLRFSIADYGRRPAIESVVRAYVWNALLRSKIEIPLPQRVVHTVTGAPVPAEGTTLQQLAARLGAVDLFSVLTQAQLEDLASGGSLREYLPGEPVVRQGEAGEELFVILNGTAEVRIRQDALASTVATLEPGQFFGEMSLLTGAPRTATVIAKTILRVLAVGKDALARLLEEDGKLLELISGVVAKRQTETATAREQLTRESAATAVSKQHESLIDRIQAYLWGDRKG